MSALLGSLGGLFIPALDFFGLGLIAVVPFDHPVEFRPVLGTLVSFARVVLKVLCPTEQNGIAISVIASHPIPQEPVRRSEVTAMEVIPTPIMSLYWGASVPFEECRGRPHRSGNVRPKFRFTLDFRRYFLALS